MTLKHSLFFFSLLWTSLQGDLVTEIDDLLVQHSFNGSLLVSKDNDPIIERHLGVEANSQFIIGSLSKQITAVLVLQAVEKGSLDLHKTLDEYLQPPECSWLDQVTIHQLLTHSSGGISFDAPLSFKPGTKFCYSNFGYNLLGLILEKVSGYSFKELIQELFAFSHQTVAPPSGTILDLRNLFPHLAMGRIENDFKVSLDRDDCDNPSGGLISTAKDLWQWNMKLHQGELLSKESYALFCYPHIHRPHRFDLHLHYGYGMQVSKEQSILEFSHNGVLPGYLSTMLYYPEQKISVIILENRISWSPTWSLEEQKRILFLHDQIRLCVRKHLAQN